MLLPEVQRLTTGPGTTVATLTIYWDYKVLEEFGSLQHPAAPAASQKPSSCITSHAAATPAASLKLTMIKKPSKCTIYFSFYILNLRCYKCFLVTI